MAIDIHPHKPLQVDITFRVEPADRSVGIMSESFAAWIKGDEKEFWVELTDLGRSDTPHERMQVSTGPKFQWYNRESDETDECPFYALVVERALWAFAHAWYESCESGDEP